MKYLLSRKEVDGAVVEWESFYNNGVQTISLPIYIRQKQATKMLKDILEFGITPEVAKELLKKFDKTE
jgi:hypothetical protein